MKKTVLFEVVVIALSLFDANGMTPLFSPNGISQMRGVSLPPMSSFCAPLLARTALGASYPPHFPTYTMSSQLLYGGTMPIVPGRVGSEGAFSPNGISQMRGVSLPPMSSFCAPLLARTALGASYPPHFPTYAMPSQLLYGGTMPIVPGRVGSNKSLRSAALRTLNRHSLIGFLDRFKRIPTCNIKGQQECIGLAIEKLMETLGGKNGREAYCIRRVIKSLIFINEELEVQASGRR